MTLTNYNANLDIDTTLGGDNASDYVIPSQKAIKDYVDNHSGGSAPVWGNITGTLSSQTDLQNALDDKMNLGSFLVPDTTGLTPIATYEYDVTNTTYYNLCSFGNNSSDIADVKGVAVFKITVTGTDINSTVEGIISMQKQINSIPLILLRNSNSTTNATSGLNIFRSIYPTVLNNGADWYFGFNCSNNTLRHIKIEVFKSDTGFIWYDSLTRMPAAISGQNSVNTSVSTLNGIIGTGQFYINVTSSGVANYISQYLPKFLGNTFFQTGDNFTSGKIAYYNGRKLYDIETTTNPIDTDCGIVAIGVTVAANNNIANNNVRTINAVSGITVNRDTLNTGAPCYLRCTMDSSGKIYSDAYIATSMTPGYTWYFLGIAYGAGSIYLNTTSSMFYTLDSNGKLTHINGEEILQPDLSNFVQRSELAEVATSGDYDDLTNKPTIPTVGNGTITFTQGGVNKGSITTNQSNNTTIALDSGSVNIDNETITTNSLDEIQTVAVIDANTGNTLKQWSGTRAQYEAIASKDNNTVYNITDDSNVSLSLLETLYPVGAVYIGTMAACPLAALGVGTWQLVAADRVLQGAGTNTVGTTLEAGLPDHTHYEFAISTQNWGDGTNNRLSDVRQVSSTANNSGYSSYALDPAPEDATVGLSGGANNAVYGNSTTVQPPAYVVNIWERIS